MPSIIGFGAVLDNLSDFLDNSPLAATIIGVTAAWLVVWSFLSGGIIDRLARARRTRSHGFFAACGMHFWRLLRLGDRCRDRLRLSVPLRSRLDLRRCVRRLTHDVTVERTAFAIRLAGYAIFGALLLVVQRHLRLRPHPNRRRGPAQRDRRAPRGRAVRAAATRGSRLGFTC